MSSRQRRFVTWRRLIHAAVVLFVAFVACLWFMPLPAALSKNEYATLMLGRQGRPIAARIAADHQWRFAPVDHLPGRYKKALLTFEDKRFYEHPGVDPIAIVRAAWQDARAGRIVSGGSTITMQLARILRGNPPRTVGEKIIEALLALRLELHLSKDDILIQYASRAPLGGNTIGMRAASWRYFHRAPGKLSWAEAAMLAVLPNNPGLIRSRAGRQILLAKRNRLLADLVRVGDMTPTSLRLAKLEKLPRTKTMPHLAPRLLNTLIKRTDAPVLHTTIDAALQRQVKQLAEKHGRQLEKYGVHNMAVVVIDNRNLKVRAYLGNITHGNPVTYGRDVDVAISPRSTGSILKPFLYGLMLDDGSILPDMLVADLPTDYGGYSPRNYDRQYRGAVPAHVALAESLNVPAVRLLHRYGVARFESALDTLGMTTLFRPPDGYGLTLILGGAEGRLDQLTGMYARMVDRARGAAPAGIMIVKHHRQKAKPFPISPGASWLTLKALRNVVRPGTARHWRLFSASQAIAWKTGTSYGLHDAWAIGSNGQYTVGVWTGNANGEPAPQLIGAVSSGPMLLDTFSILGDVPLPPAPHVNLKKLTTCVDDGFLADGLCAHTQQVLVPLGSHFSRVTPYHIRIHLDRHGQRVNSRCASVATMHSLDWFVLPPGEAYFYRQRHPDYQPLPTWRSDCVQSARALVKSAPMALIYPDSNSAMYIPVELNGQRGKVIFRAVHRRPDATIYWHLDDHYLGKTTHFNQWALRTTPGWHTLTLVDDRGFRLTRRFKILAK